MIQTKIAIKIEACGVHPDKMSASRSWVEDRSPRQEDPHVTATVATPITRDDTRRGMADRALGDAEHVELIDFSARSVVIAEAAARRMNGRPLDQRETETLQSTRDALLGLAEYIKQGNLVASADQLSDSERVQRFAFVRLADITGDPERADGRSLAKDTPSVDAIAALARDLDHLITWKKPNIKRASDLSRHFERVAKMFLRGMSRPGETYGYRVRETQ